MISTKAEFRAVRERVGLTQKMLADQLGNTIDMVKKWENPKYSNPPQDAITLLENALDSHQRIVDEAIRHVHATTSLHEGKPQGIDLLYYRSQAQYDKYGRDVGEYNVVNARTREIAVRLQQDGYPVTLHYPEDLDEHLFHTLASTRR